MNNNLYLEYKSVKKSNENKEKRLMKYIYLSGICFAIQIAFSVYTLSVIFF